MKTYNVGWRETEKTGEAGHNTLAEATAGLALDEVIDLAVSCDAHATLRDDRGFTVGHVEPSGQWRFV